VPSPPAPVLIVEDNPETRLVLRTVLELKGYVVAESSRAAEALEYLGAGMPACLIVLDVNLPDMSGAALRAELRRDPELAKIPVIVFSAMEDDGSLTDVVAYVRKGINPEQLLQLVDQACGKPRG
jgi:CheY-like chemotaxis protein